MKPSRGKNDQISNKKELNKTLSNKKNKEKSASTIQNYFKNVSKSFIADVNKCKNRDDTKAFYIEALKNKLQGISAERVVESQSGSNENEDQQGDCGDEVILANECDIFHATPSISQINGKETTNSSGCNVCAQKMIDSQEWEKKCQEWEKKCQEWEKKCQEWEKKCQEWEKKCQEWEKKCQEGEKKYGDLKKTYLKTCHRFTELELKHNDLLKTAFRSNVHSDTDVAVTSSDGVYTPNEIKVLQSIPLDKTKDSTFILKCMEYAYKADPSVLIFKTLKGTAEWIEISEEGEEEYHAGKGALTPTKVARIKELFIDRVSKGATTSVDFGDRVKDSNINRLISSGIKNVAKKQK